jgi:predicted nuclease with RNAse H fold
VDNSLQGVGIDVAADSLWMVGLAGFPIPHVESTLLVHPFDETAAVDFCQRSSQIAIDAPGGLSALAHLEDRRISAKFRRARCSEVALARAGIPVAWITPSQLPLRPAMAWMETGFSLWQALEAKGMAPLESYPHGVMWRLAGRAMTKKQRPHGHLARIAVLRRYIELPAEIEMWSHDGLDALLAAYAAWQSVHGLAERIDCSADVEWATHDGSAMLLPRVDDSIVTLANV